MPEEKDEKLVTKYLKGDERALEILIKRYLKPIYSFIYKRVNNFQEAEDITQEVFVRMWRNVKRFDRKKSFRAWIFTIAKNTTIDFLRKSKIASAKKIDNTFLEKLASSFNLLEFFEKKDAANKLSLALEKLSTDCRTIFSLRYNEYLTFREIAEILKQPLNTVKSRHRRVLIQLKKLLSQN